MKSMDNKVVYVDGKAMARLWQSLSGVVTVVPYPSCSLGTRLMIITWVRAQGYEAR